MIPVTAVLAYATVGDLPGLALMAVAGVACWRLSRNGWGLR